MEWLIVGGGIHGVHIAARLLEEGRATQETLRILDPNPKLLDRWRACTAATGMVYLRSPSVHHLDLEAWSLQRFAGRRKTRRSNLFSPPYDRPALALFNDHCDQVIDAFQLDQLHICARAVSCHVSCDRVEIETDQGTSLCAQRVVFALGAGDQPTWPSWALEVVDRVDHIFETDFVWSEECSSQAVAVVGGGISAGQVALRLAAQENTVHLITRHPLKKFQFDSDPCWIGPKCMADFQRVQSMGRRRAMISEARHRGSMPPDVYYALKRAVRSGAVVLHHTEVTHARADATQIHLDTAEGAAISVDRALLATGFGSHRPGGKMLERLIESAHLPCAECGFPIVDNALRWHPRIFVTGPLAELELGPTARNIVGARAAAKRIALCG